ncbi:MAG TPA: hypothetical protein VLH40_08690 [Atribacteraceae bacterium]|nr:hypothetical protein [Atribacteraceae bacterium]
MKVVFGVSLVFLLFLTVGLAWAEPEDKESAHLESYVTPWSDIERLVSVREHEADEQGKLMISGDYSLSYKIVFPSEEILKERLSYWTDRLNLALTYQISDHLKVGIHLKITDIFIDP